MITRENKPQNPRRDKGRNKTIVLDKTKRREGKEREENKAETLRTGFKIWHFY
jgi:hypothetical protein